MRRGAADQVRERGDGAGGHQRAAVRSARAAGAVAAVRAGGVHGLQRLLRQRGDRPPGPPGPVHLRPPLPRLLHPDQRRPLHQGSPRAQPRPRHHCSHRQLRHLLRPPSTHNTKIDNGVPIISYYDDKNDTELLHLIEYLKIVNQYKDVRDANRDILKLQ